MPASALASCLATRGVFDDEPFRSRQTHKEPEINQLNRTPYVAKKVKVI
jgi:hypothetical protein